MVSFTLRLANTNNKMEWPGFVVNGSNNNSSLTATGQALVSKGGVYYLAEGTGNVTAAQNSQPTTLITDAGTLATTVNHEYIFAYDAVASTAYLYDVTADAMISYTFAADDDIQTSISSGSPICWTNG